MKYLKKYNESIVDDLKDLTENYLAYLTDEDFIYDIRKADGEIQISIRKDSKWDFNNGITTPTNSDFGWQEVKDKVIPFLFILKKDYTINSIDFRIFKKDDGTGDRYGRQMDDGWIRGCIKNNLEDVINDKITNQNMNSLIISIDDSDKKVKEEPKKSLLNRFIKKFA